MRIILYILLIILVGVSYAEGQSKMKSSDVSFDMESPISLLNKAEELIEHSPLQSIKLLEHIFQLKSVSVDADIYGRAYLMLGDIYEDIGQLELAIQRYEMAFKFIGKNNLEELANSLVKKGKIEIQLQQWDNAEKSLRNALRLTKKDTTKFKCEAGIIDVYIGRGKTNDAFLKISELERENNLNSSQIVSLESRKSQIYSQKNQFDSAAVSLQTVYNNIGDQVVLYDVEMESVEKAQDKLFTNAGLSNEMKIAFQTAIDYNEVNTNSNLVKENVRLSKNYESVSDFPNARKALDISKDYIDDSSDDNLVAEIFKKSYEFNLRSGNDSKAFEDFDKYIKVKERALAEQESKLERQVEIVKSQKKLDVSLIDLKLQEKERDLMQSQLYFQQTAIGLLSILVLASLVFFYFLRRNIKEKQRANQLLELKSLRTQMNPHFIFNALNSVNNFIAKNDEKSANKYLSEFSYLMRMVLDYSKKDFISLREEINLNKLYLKLEHFRFRDKFEYDISYELPPSQMEMEVPPMLIQPFIENAVWHGLRYKESNGKLTVQFRSYSEYIEVEVTDNGIGREESQKLKTVNQQKHKSSGLSNIENRLEVLNKTYGVHYSIQIVDILEDNKVAGTAAIIRLPFKEDN